METDKNSHGLKWIQSRDRASLRPECNATAITNRLGLNSICFPRTTFLPDDPLVSISFTRMYCDFAFRSAANCIYWFPVILTI
jgi:hypothetical protein